ncbi:chemotaxis-specific protein-glutamate methyltransferase CheB [Planomonospora sp. ID82291]|uniref:chemotaxis-specific protein-glutamate methyltransferase CheB n=1 Tax=Planomonospora sp. ID82291 TaxID=2738136 RepID=UPI0018C355FC|nr:chemotaxis-specific protein-glutamate methyltransferase CheB [Planomonospora sp. ID82291]MBG0818595.1 chemotaxis-specific protein-glutamate methyltransferase CheB [Planomonospora sp. ID82291]
MPATSVLVVDDSALMRKVIKRILTETGEFEVHTARNGLDALEQLRRVQPDVVTLDVNMPEMDGLTCLNEIMRQDPRPVVMVSSLTEDGALVTLEALAVGAVDYVAKPGGTVSLNLQDVAAELVAKVRAAAGARVRRAGGLTARLRTQRARAAESAAPARRTRAPAARTQAAPADLVIIGASTGGPALLADILSRLPASFPAPVVVAQHIPGSFTTALAQRLDGACALDVHEVVRPMPMHPGHIYVGRGDADVLIARGPAGLVVKCVPASSAYRWHPSVDRLVASAHRVVEAQRLVCVQLTGMGDDGAGEMAAVKSAGGRTIAEAEETAVVWGMPGELVRRGGATAVLPNHLIASRLIDWVR